MIVDVPTFDLYRGSKNWAARNKIGIPDSSKGSPVLGLYMAVGPTLPPESELDSNQFCDINFTGPPGSGSIILFRFLFQFPKWSYGIAKVDEWIDVSPANKEYYDRTMSTKEQLAGSVKTGLASAASAVADYELVEHDARRYREILNFFQKKNEHSLRAMFIDQVDVHNGNMAMVQMVQRWSTLIQDFQDLRDEDTGVDRIAKRLKIPKAEAVVLKTKNLLYLEWKDMFKKASVERYERLKSLLEARKKSIHEYREWIRPYIVRFQRLKAGHAYAESRNAMLKSFIDISGQYTYMNHIRFWTWKYFTPVETRRAPIERTKDFGIDPWDDFIREELALHPKFGLAALYPWLLGPHSKNPKLTKADEIVESIKKDIIGGKLAPAVRPYYTYYTFIDLEVMRAGIRLPQGEQEDITFKMKNFVFSANIMLLKLLEMKCRELQLDKYIDQILGVRSGDEKIIEAVRKEYPDLYGVEKPKEKKGMEKIVHDITTHAKKYGQWYEKFQKRLSKPRTPGKLMIVKPGPYEFDFSQRINKGYLVPIGRHYHAVIEGFLKKEMGAPGF